MSFETFENGLKRFHIWRQWAELDQKSYQTDAIKWCLFQELHGPGAILADEMGLGKTIVMIGLIVAHDVGDTLIVVPPSLLDQWKSCLTRFGCPPYVFHGEGARCNEFPNSSVVLTSYGMLKKLRQKTKKKWDRIVFDEAHNLRNRGTKAFMHAKMITAGIKWCVTGTPIQNSKGDLYALCDIIGIPKDLDLVREEFMLRRSKKDVNLILPELKFQQVTVGWQSKDEENLARQIHNIAVPNENEIITQLGAAHWHGFTRMMRARQVCIFPEMLKPALKKLLGQHQTTVDDYLKKMPMSKIKAVVEHLAEKTGNCKLVFCHFRKEIDELEARLKKMNLAVGVIDGRTPKHKRKAILETNYLSKEDFDKITAPYVGNFDTTYIYQNIIQHLAYDVVIVQIQTACDGLNLQQFQEVHFVSPHWNPAVEDQAVARCHRLGQTRPVTVYRYMMENEDWMTLDGHCSTIQEKKREIISLLD